jgi:hypothetical protein
MKGGGLGGGIIPLPAINSDVIGPLGLEGNKTRSGIVAEKNLVVMERELVNPVLVHRLRVAGRRNPLSKRVKFLAYHHGLIHMLFDDYIANGMLKA